jgi:medium-chain acyl-[acyl-carrier-protein] hydrolase
MYHAWADLLMPSVELWLIHLPGREKRIKETPYKIFSQLTGSLADAIRPSLDMPFAFFGHSMGGLLGFEVARQVREKYGLQPIHLFISGRRAPHLPDSLPALYELPESEFLRQAEDRYGRLPDIIKEDPEILHLFLSILRADLEMLDSHLYEPGLPPGCPISVFGGMQDQTVKEPDLIAWRDHSSTPFNLKMFQGDHFFFQQAKREIIQILNDELAHSLESRAGLSPAGFTL